MATLITSIYARVLLAAMAYGLLVPVASAALIELELFFPVNQAIADNTEYVDRRTVPGLLSIAEVKVELTLASAVGGSAKMSDYYSTLTHGQASESERMAVLLNRPGLSDTDWFGSAAPGGTFLLDDSGSAPSSFHLTGTGVYQADGRSSVDPTSWFAPAYDAGAATSGLAGLAGAVLPSNSWSLLVADTRMGGTGQLVSWTLVLLGESPASGDFDPGSGGTIQDQSGATEAERSMGSRLVLDGSQSDAVTADIAQSFEISGGLKGSGELRKPVKES